MDDFLIVEPDLPQKPRTDVDSTKENDFLSGDIKRGEQQKNAVHVMFLVLLWIVVVILISALLTRAAHLVLPLSWQWLSNDQIQGLDKYLTSGLIGIIIGKFGDKLAVAFTDKK